VRVRVIGWEKVAGGFDGRMRGLNGDLRGGEIAPDQNVQVMNLGERSGHGSFPLG
jgi:hypothetical protein